MVLLRASTGQDTGTAPQRRPEHWHDIWLSLYESAYVCDVFAVREFLPHRINNKIWPFTIFARLGTLRFFFLFPHCRSLWRPQLFKPCQHLQKCDNPAKHDRRSVRAMFCTVDTPTHQVYCYVKKLLLKLEELWLYIKVIEVHMGTFLQLDCPTTLPQKLSQKTDAKTIVFNTHQVRLKLLSA